MTPLLEKTLFWRVEVQALKIEDIFQVPGQSCHLFKGPTPSDTSNPLNPQRISAENRKHCLRRGGVASEKNTPPQNQHVNMSPENQWLEDIFPTEIYSPFLGEMSS